MLAGQSPPHKRQPAGRAPSPEERARGSPNSGDRPAAALGSAQKQPQRFTCHCSFCTNAYIASRRTRDCSKQLMNIAFFNLPTTLRGKRYSYSHFTVEKTEAQSS